MFWEAGSLLVTMLRRLGKGLYGLKRQIENHGPAQRREYAFGDFYRADAQSEHCARRHPKALGSAFFIERNISRFADLGPIRSEDGSSDQFGKHLGRFQIDFAW